MSGITAHVPHCQRHMCSVPTARVQCYSSGVQPEQKIIADWIERTRERLGWSYAEWAERAGIGAATTVTRALKPDYPSVTSVKTLAALATAAGEPSILDFLQGADGPADRPTVVAPNAEALSHLLGAVLPLAPRGRQTAQSLRVVAAALQSGLELLAEQSANGEEPALGVASRVAVARFRDLTQQ
jgi:hypothetical protein